MILESETKYWMIIGGWDLCMGDFEKDQEWKESKRRRRNIYSVLKEWMKRVSISKSQLQEENGSFVDMRLT